jgi:hypothetical protein
MNTFQPGDLAMIMGHNTYWDGCIVKITSPLIRQLGLSHQGHVCELVVLSPAMMDPSRASKKIGSGIGAWWSSLLEIPKNFSALCPYCKGNSFCEVNVVTETGTAFKCNTHGRCGLRHDSRSIEEAKWLTPTSKWAWFTLLPVSQWPNQLRPQETIIPIKGGIPKLIKAPPACICDVFNFGCTCPALQWEKSKND